MLVRCQYAWYEGQLGILRFDRRTKSQFTTGEVWYAWYKVVRTGRVNHAFATCGINKVQECKKKKGIVVHHLLSHLNGDSFHRQQLFLFLSYALVV